MLKFNHKPVPQTGGSSPARLLSVGIIMDGNGRWAAARGLPRFEGHRQGVDALRRAVRAAPELGVRYLTVYSFSSENWSRPPREIMDLMGLLKRFIRNDLNELNKSGVKIKIVGERAGLKPDICALLDEAEALTRHNTRLDLVIAFNYGARQEIVEAVRQLAHEVVTGKISSNDITQQTLTERLGTYGIPDPDFIIRTSGEQRLSNFLLWQAAYSELVFLPSHWPEFDKLAFEASIAEFLRRNRRFGGLGDVSSPGEMAVLAAKAGT